MDQKDNNTIVMFDTENSIILGDYLDLLLNRTTEPREAYGESVTEGVFAQYENDRRIQSMASKLGQYECILYAKNNRELSAGQSGKPGFVYSGGIRLPHYHGADKWDEGSGNIVISGRPGVGKSTLAFQFAAACAAWPNDGIAVYFSLDVEEKQLVKSMRDSDSDLCINFLCDYSMMESSALSPYDAGTDEELEDMFRKALYKKNGKSVPQIILPKLSPRGISPLAGAETDSIFLKRIGELQKLLRAISAYNARERGKEQVDRWPFVKLVVIDSLDVFGERTLTREEINRLFMLFKQYGIIGVFTMGSSGYENLTSEAVYKAAVTYQADVVIELKREFYNNYTCSYFEVAKSRHIRHVLGHHPYKVENYQSASRKKAADKFSFQSTGLVKKIVVLPSLHYRISASENSVSPCYQAVQEPGEERKVWDKTIFGIKQIVKIMPNHFQGRSMELPQIITISGSSGLFKSDIAMNALFSGIVDRGERGLIVRLGDRDAFAVRGVRFEKKLLGRTIKKLKETEELQERKIRLYEKGEETIHNDEPNKYTLKGWTIQKQEKDPQLLEVTFKNGALLPEEFVDEICKIINIYGIRRVVFMDLKYIGSSYPFLVNSDTSGNLFLSAFVHIMRNYGMHVIMSSSESGLEPSDVELSKAGILADAILRCTIGIRNDGSEAVYISGEGLITEPRNKRAEFVIDEEKYTLQFCKDVQDKNEEVLSMVELLPFHIEFDGIPQKADQADS